MGLKEKLPRDFSIEDSLHEDYMDVEEKLESIGGDEFGNDFTYRNIFVLSAALAFKERLDREVIDKANRLIPTRGITDRQLWILSSIAVKEEGITILMDGKEIAKISEEYSNAGFPILMKIMEEGSAFNCLKRLQTGMSQSI